MKIDLNTLMARFVGDVASEPEDESKIDLDQMILKHGLNQRWRHRRDFYRPANETFNPEHWRVDLMAGQSGRAVREGGIRGTWVDGLDFILTNHYSASYPQIRVMVGMFRARDAKLVGVATFGNVLQDVRSRFGRLGEYEITGLDRFVLLDEVPGNAETWFLARARTLVREIHRVRGYSLRAIISYSDPVPRTDCSGRLVMPGHCGNIYQAANALYLGFSRSKTMHLDARGLELHPRMLSKIRKLDVGGEKGSLEAKRRFAESGVAPRRRGESYASWVQRGLNSPIFRTVSHGGNLTYAWPIGDRRERRSVLKIMPERQPYPAKTPRQLYLNLHRKYRRLWSEGRVGEAASIAQRMNRVWMGVEEVFDLGGTPRKMIKEDRVELDPPPMVGASCSIGSGSSNRKSSDDPAWSLFDVLSTSICRI